MLFDYHENYILENHRVRLEPLNEHHIEELSDWAKEPGIWTYFLGRSNGAADFEHYVLDAIHFREKKKEYPFAIYDKAKSKYAGCTRFFDYQSDLKVIRLGYTWYGSDFRGTGINKNCKYLMFQFAFEELNLERVGLGAHIENTISIAAMKSVGCIEEGRIRNAFPSIKIDGRADAILLGILKDEWFRTKKEILKNKL